VTELKQIAGEKEKYAGAVMKYSDSISRDGRGLKAAGVFFFAQ
jgi:hypothetical protein